jgi:hypothetical protein
MQKDPKTGLVLPDDLTGQVHSNGTTAIVFHAKTSNGGSKWLLRCACGTEFVAWAESFKRGVLCRQCRNALIAAHRITHGGKYRTEYKSWSGMKNRCLNPAHEDFRLYGGRGITVCERWLESFENFLEDMGPKPPKTSLDRIDNNKGYTPENCRWASNKLQSNNRRTNRTITFNGKTQTYKQWSEELGLGSGTIRMRVLSGWPTWKVLSRERYRARNRC